MTPQEKADNLVNQYRIVLMRDDTECGNEILCTTIAKQCALIAVDFAKELIIGDLNESFDKNLYLLNKSFDKALYLFEVKQEIEKL